MTTCPNCQKPVDPIRSRHVSVREGKVVAYCSAECLASATTQPVRAPTGAAVTASPSATSAAAPASTAAIASGSPDTSGSAIPKASPLLDSGPVIQILHEPASGVVTSAADKRTPTSPDDKAKADKPKDKKAEKAERKAAEKAEKERRASEKRVAENKPPEQVAAKPAEPKPQPTPTDVGPSLDDIVAAATKPADAKKQSAMVIDDSLPDDQPTVVGKLSARTAGKAADNASGAEPEYDIEVKGPVSALADAAASQPKRKRNRRDSIDARSAWEWLDEEPAEPVRPGRRSRVDDDADDDAEPRKGSRLMQVVFIVGLVGVMAAGGYFFYDRYMKQQTPAPAVIIIDAPKPTVEDVQHVAPDAPVVEAPSSIKERALANAIAVLLQHLESPEVVESIKEKAAIALSRARDPKAIAWLADAMPRAGTETKRLEIAYALARAGDPRGRDTLVAALKARARDTRIDAAKKLALLRDKAAVDALVYYLDLPQSRYEVAKALAQLGDKRGLKFLEGMRYDTDDDKARAALALVSADAAKADVVAEVEGMLTDDTKKSYRHEASLVLAEKQNEKARPILLANLGVQQTQAEVARALRRVAPEADLSPQLAELEKGIASEKDLQRIKAAEAIILLAGQPEWAEHP